MSAVEALHRDNDFRLLRTQEDPVANASWCFMHATRFPRDAGYRACFSTLLIKEVREFQKRVSDRLTLQSTNGDERIAHVVLASDADVFNLRSEERRVGKECRSRWRLVL